MRKAMERKRKMRKVAKSYLPNNKPSLEEMAKNYACVYKNSVNTDEHKIKITKIANTSMDKVVWQIKEEKGIEQERERYYKFLYDNINEQSYLQGLDIAK